MPPAIEQKFRTVYDPGPKQPGITFESESLTKQSFKEETDINNIMKRFLKTGQLPDMIQQNPQYGDFADVLDYQEALTLVHHAQEQFENLSAEVRDRFGNDPEKFLAFTNDSKNLDEMEKLGLLKDKPLPTIPGSEADFIKKQKDKEKTPVVTPPPTA